MLLLSGAASARFGVVVFLDGDGADRGDLVEQIVAPVAAGTSGQLAYYASTGSVVSGETKATIADETHRCK